MGSNTQNLFSYDDNDRLASRQYAVQSQPAGYVYETGANLLDHVTNQIKPGSTRDASANGTFRYDANGNLVDDESKRKWVNYDADGLVTQIGFTSIDSTSGGQYIFPYYDADGNVVTLATAVNRSTAYGSTGRTHYVRLGGNVQKEIREGWNYTSPTSMISRAQIVNVIGQSSVISRRLADGSFNFYLKDCEGSTIRVVDATGAVVGSYDYRPYGDLRTLHGESPDVSEKWTGKEYFEGPGLYYFGARWYDPELGVWSSPDPAGQFNSPYGYGGDPINYMDPNGLWRLGFGITFGYTRHGGFSLGVGASAQVDGLGGGVSRDYSYKTHSWSTSVSASGTACYYVVCTDDAFSYNYDDKSHTSTISGSADVGLGNMANRGVIGIEGSRTYDGNGDVIGGTYGWFTGYRGTYGDALTGHESGYGKIQGRGWYASSNVGFLETSYSQHGGLNYGASYSGRIVSYDSDKGWDYVGKNIVDAYNALTKPEPIPINGTYEPLDSWLSNWGGTNWCGKGGQGGAMDAVDYACYEHDKRYGSENAEGPADAFANFSSKIIAADIALMTTVWDNFGSNHRAAFEVGTVFGIIAYYKAAENIIRSSYTVDYARRHW